MKTPRVLLTLLSTSAVFALALWNVSLSSVAQDSKTVQNAPAPLAASAPTAVPSLVPYSGVAIGGAGKPMAGETGITFQIFKDEAGGEALWTETQTVAIDSTGHYKVQLGATSPNGLPPSLFASGEARWLEVQIAGEPAQTRVLLASVPYALKAGDATTLGGLPASAFVLAGSKTTSEAAGQGVTSELVSDVTTTGGTAGYLPEFSGASTIVDSPVFVSGSNVGIGTATPAQTLDVNGTTVFRSNVYVYHNGTATPSGGVNSVPMVFLTEGYNSSTKAVVAPAFQWKAEVAGNNTASPSATQNLLYSNGTTTAETGFSFNPNGTLNFAPGQTFPGAGTITGVTAGTGLTGGGTSGAVTLKLDTTKVPQLNSANSFTGNQAITGNLSATGSATVQGPGSFDTSGTASVGLSGIGIVSGVSGQATGSAANSAGVLGTETSPTGVVYGVAGLTNSTTDGAAGVGGEANALTGSVVGVAGTSSSTGNGTTGVAAGVSGLESATTGKTFGVYGESDSTSGYGVAGSAKATSGFVYGVYGLTASPNGTGVYGQNNATSGSANGVYGSSQSSTDGAAGVSGFEGATTGQVSGVMGSTNSPSGSGVTGLNNSTNSGGAGVYGFTNAASGNGSGVTGTAVDSAGSDFNFGVLGIAGAHGVGVQGSSPTVGVAGFNQVCGSSGCTLVSGTAGEFVTGTGGTILSGSSGSGNSNTTKQVFYVDSSGDGFFGGNLNVTGKVSKGSGSFKIDDPLDPANKYLSHSFVESPDMMNVYNGNVTTDKHGRATVELPEYFEALNRDFRYQLTVMGQFAQAIVAQEIGHNRFVIRTSKPSVKVSWQVTGIRKDAYANANRIPVEEVKPTEERGYYLHPEVYGQPASKGIVAAHRPEGSGTSVAQLGSTAKP
jgi:hypothetical protein